MAAAFVAPWGSAGPAAQSRESRVCAEVPTARCLPPARAVPAWKTSRSMQCSLSPVLFSLATAFVACRSRRRGRGGVLLRRGSEVDVEQRLREVESAMMADDEEVLSDVPELSRQVEGGRPRYAETRSLPRVLFLPEPKYRAFVANVPGDSGFDPLGLCSDVPTFVQYREAELKHGRLAMFAAVAWPLAEIVDQSLVDSDDATQQSYDFLAETGGKMLPQLGGENDTFVEIFAAVVLLVGGSFELFKSGQEAPGEAGFDPLNLKSFRPPVLSSFLPENRQSCNILASQ